MTKAASEMGSTSGRLEADGSTVAGVALPDVFRERISALKLSILRQVPPSGADALDTGAVES